MGSGTIERKDYHTKQGFFTVKDTDERHGGEFWFLKESFDDVRFFYVKPLPGSGDRYEVTGEGYLYTKSQKEHLTAHKKELRSELNGVMIHYYFIDDNGRVPRRGCCRNSGSHRSRPRGG